MKEKAMTPSQAKKLLQAELNRRNLPYAKLTAKTINFMDLARADAIFVKIHGWTPNPAFDDLRTFGKANGFIVQS